MQTYVFIGSLCEIGPYKLERYGHTIRLDEADAKLAIVEGGAGLLPEDRFHALGFTPDELKTVAFPGQREGADPDVKAKVTESYKALHAYRQELEGTEVI